MHFGDRLQAAINQRNAPVCVGLDPLFEKLPPALRTGDDLASRCKAFLEFGKGIIESVAAQVPAIKINIAFFEPYGARGLEIYHDLIRFAHQHELLVIGDIKRADIGHTSGQYAAAHLATSIGIPDDAAIADAVTINPYFGSDGVKPFIDLARTTGRGVFILVQTSNESAAQVQGLILPDGLTVCQHVARLVQTWASADGTIGPSGYSSIGAVVSPRDIPSTVRIRELMPNCIFLVPGFGAQGRTADEVAKCFKPDGTGAIVAASRSVIFAHDEPDHRHHTGDWRKCVRKACEQFVTQVRQVIGGSPGR